jgi:hypothetical protein
MQWHFVSQYILWRVACLSSYCFSMFPEILSVFEPPDVAFKLVTFLLINAHHQTLYLFAISTKYIVIILLNLTPFCWHSIAKSRTFAVAFLYWLFSVTDFWIQTENLNVAKIPWIFFFYIKPDTNIINSFLTYNISKVIE